MITIRDRYLRLNKDGVYEPVGNAKIVLQADTAPLSVNTGSGFRLVESPFTVETRTDPDGWWQFQNVPEPSECAPNTVQFIVTFPDRVSYIGVVPPVITPVDITTLVNTYSWGLVSPSYGGQVSAIVGQQGPQGDQGIQGIQGIQGPPGSDGIDGQDGAPGITDLVTQLVNGIMRASDKRKLDSTVSVLDFGAVGDGVTDDSAAIQAAIRSFDASGSRGGSVYFPYTTAGYKINQSIILDRCVRLFGGTGLRPYSGSMIKVAPGVTGIRAYNIQSSPTGAAADNFILEDLHIQAISRNTWNSTATFAPNANNEITVADATLLNVGDLIVLAGAGIVAPMYGVKASTVSGNPVINLTLTGGQQGPHGFLADNLAAGDIGTRIQLAGVTFGPSNKSYTHCIAFDSSTATLAEAPNQTQSNLQVVELNNLYGEITFKSGNTIRIDTNDGAVSVTDELIMRNDCGVYAKCRGSIFGVTTENFVGNGFHWQASLGYTPQSNANNWHMERSTTYFCRAGIYVDGNDTNQGIAINCDPGFSRGWNVLDASHLGCTWIGLHTLGGRGYKTIFDAVQHSTFISCYAEGGTYNSLSTGNIVVGGNMGSNEGSPIVFGGPPLKMNAVQWGDLTQGYTQYQLSTFPTGIETPPGVRPALLQLRSNTTTWPGATSLDFLKTRSSDPESGWWGWVPAAGGLNRTPYLIGDVDASGGGGANGGAGLFYMPGGFMIGSGATGLPSLASARRVEVRGAVPSTGADAPIKGGSWAVGDRVLKSVPTAEGVSGSQTVLTGWICTGAGVPGTWIEDRAWAGNPTLSPKVVASASEVAAALNFTAFATVPFANIPSGGANYAIHVFVRITGAVTVGNPRGIRVYHWDVGGEREDMLMAGALSAGFYSFTRYYNCRPTGSIQVDAFDVGTANTIFVSSSIVQLS